MALSRTTAETIEAGRSDRLTRDLVATMLTRASLKPAAGTCAAWPGE
jgi:hypothetical protein